MAIAATTLVHAFITARLDHCLTLYSGLPSSRLSCLDRVLRAAARLIGQIPKYDHVTRYMLEVLHWLPVRQRIEYRVVSLVWRCHLGLAPAYLIDPVSYTHLRAHETPEHLVCRLLLEKKKNNNTRT